MTAMGAVLPDHTSCIDAATPMQFTATVAQTGGGLVLIDHQGVISAAKVALSCLVQPESGDQVLVTLTDDAWVTAILSRTGTAPLRVLTTRDAVIGVPGTTLTLNAGTLNVHAATATTMIEALLHTGHTITAQLGRVRVIASMVETIAHSILVQAKSCLRMVDDADQLRARTIDHAATNSLHLQADCAFMTGGTAIRLDADQIHMG